MMVAMATDKVSAKDVGKETITVSFNDIAKMDQMVDVANNQFILNINKTKNIDPVLISALTEQLNSVNTEIRNKNGLIGSNKQVYYPTVGFRGGTWAHQIDSFWWGHRDIFRTDAAVNDFAHDLDTFAVYGLLVGAASSFLTFGTGVVGATITSAYCTKLASDLRYQKSKYAKIELDTTFAMIYRVIEWTD